MGNSHHANMSHESFADEQTAEAQEQKFKNERWCRIIKINDENEDQPSIHILKDDFENHE
jgi:hypothetical protein